MKVTFSNGLIINCDKCNNTFIFILTISLYLMKTHKIKGGIATQIATTIVEDEEKYKEYHETKKELFSLSYEECMLILNSLSIPNPLEL